MQQQKLTASDGAAGDSFGGAVVLSGTTALVGVAGKTVGGLTSQGAAYVFVQSGSSWTQQQKLTASDGAAYDDFGSAVALSGTTVIVGAFGKTVSWNAGQGAAYVFVQNGGVWTEQQKLTASDGAVYDNFGVSVALSGTTALIGAYNKAVGAYASQGAAYVFVQGGTNWAQQQQLTSGNGGTAFFGTSVALSGTAAIVGGTGNDSKAGTAYVFSLTGLAGASCSSYADCATTYTCVDGVCCTSDCGGLHRWQLRGRRLLRHGLQRHMPGLQRVEEGRRAGRRLRCDRRWQRPRRRVCCRAKEQLRPGRRMWRQRSV